MALVNKSILRRPFKPVIIFGNMRQYLTITAFKGRLIFGKPSNYNRLSSKSSKDLAGACSCAKQVRSVELFFVLAG
jgi:hypothetical protein